MGREGRRRRDARRRASRIAFATLVLLSGAGIGCRTKEPVLYPNQKLYDVGPEVAKEDVAWCTQRAQEVAPGEAGEAARSTAGGAAVGAATGAAVGAVTGHGRAAGAGAAGGAAHGFTRWLLGRRDPDPVVKSYVEICLRELGYRPIGWK